MKNKMYLFLLSVFLILIFNNLCYSQFFEEDYLYLGETKGVKIFINNNEIYFNEKKNEYMFYTKVTTNSSKKYFIDKCNCDTRIYTGLESYISDKNGTIIHSREAGKVEMKILPNTNLELIYYFLCK